MLLHKQQIFGSGGLAPPDVVAVYAPSVAELSRLRQDPSRASGSRQDVSGGSAMDKDAHTTVNHRRLDRLRRGRGPVPEHIIDEFVSRNSRRGTMIGLSLP